MKALRPFLLLTSLCLSLASCQSDDKEQDDDPTPAAQYTMARAIEYPATAEVVGVRYAVNSITGAGTLDQGQLALSFTTNYDHSAVSFTITPDRLKAGLVGSYPLKSQPDLSLGAAAAHYALPPADNSQLTRLYDSQWNKLEGNIEITSYNEKKHLISGSYELVLNDLPDPLVPGLDDSGKKRANLTLSGDFSNVVLR